MKHASILLATAVALASCATPAPTISQESTLQTQGKSVALKHPVAAGPLVLTALRVVEDSRCPAGVQCVWAGRVIVATQVEGQGWREELLLQQGQAQAVRGHRIVLTEIAPEAQTAGSLDPAAYRFRFQVN